MCYRIGLLSGHMLLWPVPLLLCLFQLPPRSPTKATVFGEGSFNVLLHWCTLLVKGPISSPVDFDNYIPPFFQPLHPYTAPRLHPHFPLTFSPLMAQPERGQLVVLFDTACLHLQSCISVPAASHRFPSFPHALLAVPLLASTCLCACRARFFRILVAD